MSTAAPPADPASRVPEAPPLPAAPAPENRRRSTRAPVRAVEPVRAPRLQQVFDKAIEKTVGTVSYSNFAKCFPIQAQGSPALLKAVHGQMIGNWEKRARDEFSKIEEERNVVPLLNELDELRHEAEVRQKRAPEGTVPVVPSSLPPVVLVTAHVTPLLQQAHETLAKKTKTVDKQNEKLMREIEKQNEELLKLLEQIEAVKEHMEKAVEEANSAVKGLDVEMEELGA